MHGQQNIKKETNLIVPFHNFAEAPKDVWNFTVWSFNSVKIFGP